MAEEELDPSLRWDDGLLKLDPSLRWDDGLFKLVGRRLIQTGGMMAYSKWIPGCWDDG
jgi:hypothetical protein